MNQKLLLITGQFSFVAGIAGFLYNCFYPGFNVVIAFIAGVLFGLSMVMNVAYLLKSQKLRAS